MSPKGISERDLYPQVRRWLARAHRCFATGIERGYGYGRVDVVGVRDIGGDLSGRVEIIAIEVKHGRQRFGTSAGQTAGYRMCADRVYLADNRAGGFTADEFDIANHLGIGLIRISGKKCTEVLTSPSRPPHERFRRVLLERLGLGICQFCESVFEIGTAKKRFSKVTGENVKLALAEERGLMYWNRLVGSRKRRGRAENDPDVTYERRFMCPDCIGLMGLLHRGFEEEGE